VHVPPETRYARSGDIHIAYQVVGHGPLDLVFVMGWVSHLDYFWNELHFARFLRRLASFSRLILFDKRGTGLSDRAAGLPTLEQRTDDVRAVMDAVGSNRAALIGISEGASMCMLFAATYPERVTGLVIVGGFGRRIRSPDYPWGADLDERLRALEQFERDWGNDTRLAIRAPSLVHDARFRDWWRTYLRMSASPGAAVALTRMNMEIDIRPVLPAIRVPTLVVHRTGDQTVTVGNGRYLAEHIPGARYVELPGDDHLPFVGDQEAILREIELFLTGSLPTPEPDRVLATLLVTGVVGAVASAVRLGDRAWAERLAAHDALVREQLARFRGREARRTIGGIVATFDGPARAIRCAQAIVEAAAGCGVTVRAGLHAGECEFTGGELGGAALHVAERVSNRARPGEVLVSNTVKDLVAGSGLTFEELETLLYTGPDGGWRLHRVVPEAQPAHDRPLADLADAEAAQPPTALSRREREVAVLVARGMSNRQIADQLSISPATVERHVANILIKLGYHSRAQVAAWAVAHGLLRAAPA
jgi:pimeloyl-ACP methyl ester carboxylesterase/DNA-binding CsgD family transcriptional regulator